MSTPTGVAADESFSHPGTDASTRDGTGATAPVPSPADGVQLLGEMKGSGYRRPPALVRRADGQTITLTPLLYLTLKAMDGRRGYAGIAEVLSAATGRHVVPDDVSHLVDGKLRPLGLVAGPGGAQPTTSKMNPLLALRLKVVITDERLTRRLTAPFTWLFRSVLVVAFLAGFAAMSWWVFVDKGLGSAVHQAFYEPGMILLLWAMIIASAGFHEFGHAAACRYGGATPGAMGGGLYLVWPAFYTDVTDSYRLGRVGRLRVDLGGLYFNAIFAVLTLGIWAATRWDALLLVAVAQHLQMVRQLAPFIRADGYHIVADLTGVPDLFAHIKPTLMAVLPRRWRGATPAPELKRWARTVVVLWVATMVPVLAALIALATLMLPRLAATAWDSMSIQWEAVGYYWNEGDVLGVGVRLLTGMIVFLPVLGLLYLLARMARRAAVGSWRATEDNPAGRGAVVLVALGIAAAIAWAWWPSGQYEPVEADDSSIPELVGLEDRRVFLPLLRQELVPMRAAVTTGQDAGTVQAVAATTGAAEIGIPGATARESALTMVAPLATGEISEIKEVIAGEFVERAWPFPFPPPDQPGEGDNRAQAINTLDGSVLTDLAVSWAIVTANEVDERNEAWALASCNDCVTRAAAFQVLLLVTDSEVVVPMNAAVAANYECTRCTTEAIAVQLVISLTGMPSAEAQQLIDEAMDRVALFESDMDELTGGQIYFLLQATQAEVVRILEADGVLPDPGAATTSTATLAGGGTSPSSAESTGTTTTTGSDGSTSSTSDAETTDGSAGEPDGAATAEPTGEPTAQATSEPTSEPTGEPTPDSTGTGTADDSSSTTSTESSEPSPSAEPTSSTSP